VCGSCTCAHARTACCSGAQVACQHAKHKPGGTGVTRMQVACKHAYLRIMQKTLKNPLLKKKNTWLALDRRHECDREGEDRSSACTCASGS
jgi:hypothetical protein